MKIMNAQKPTFVSAVSWANEKQKNRNSPEKNIYLFWIILAGIIGTILVFWLIFYFVYKSKEAKEDSIIESMQSNDLHDKSAYLRSTES